VDYDFISHYSMTTIKEFASIWHQFTPHLHPMRYLILSLFAILPLLLNAQVECTINHVDPQASTIALEKNKQVGLFHVTSTSEITLDGNKSALSELQPGMHVKLTTTTDPGTIKNLDAFKNTLSTPQSPQSPSKGFTDEPITQTKNITIAAKDKDGFSINNIRKGAVLYIQYVKGQWKEHGGIAQFNPDDPKTPDSSKLAIALPRSDAGPGSVIALVSPNTVKKRFTFTADKDYQSLVLRINAAPSSNPGQVEYKVTLVPAPR